MKSRKGSIAIFVIVLALLFTGCAPKTLAPTVVNTPVLSTTVQLTIAAYPVTVTDDLQREVTFDKAPVRIVVAGRATTLLLDAMYMFPEARQSVVAYEKRLQTSDDFMPVIDPAAVDKASLQKDSSAEQIAPLNPDLVILKTYMADTLGKPLEEIGIKVVYLDLETPDVFMNDIQLMGKIFGDSTRAETILQYYQGTQASIQNYTKPLPTASNPKVLLLQYSNKGGTINFSVPATGWIQTSMVEMAGGTPVWTEASTAGAWNNVTLEQIAAWNPDMIFIIWYQGDAATVVQDVSTDPTWTQLKAMKDNQVYGFAGDFISWDQSDTRWVLGLTWLASRIHPEIFIETNIKESASVFYQTLYNLTFDQVETSIYPILKGSIAQ
jgi:iron complex transport system substrate-binding protein